MSIDKLKTVYSTGAFVNNVKTFFKKINEIIDYLNNLVIPNAPNYKIYRALLTQTGTDAPVATVLENTLGINPTLNYEDISAFSIEATGLFVLGKTFFRLGQGDNAAGGGAFYYEMDLIAQPDKLIFTLYKNSDNSQVNGLLFNTPVEIIVYN